MEKLIRMLKKVNLGVGLVALLIFVSAPLIFVGSAMAQNSGSDTAVSSQPSQGGTVMNPESQAQISSWAFLAAALATGLGSIAAGYAVGHVGAAAMGAVSEKPELMGKSLIYVALAEGIAIYGLLISIILLAKV
jgi:V/A-type H+-transporting ATPase subunit K